MQVKVYVPQMVEIPSEYLSPLAKRAFESLSADERDTPATRGHLVRQAVRDGLLRQFDELMADDGFVDVYCDPRAEIPLEIDSRTFTLAELQETLHNQRQALGAKSGDKGQISSGIVPKRRAA